MIGGGAVTVNDKRARASQTLVHGDTVEVQVPEAPAPRQLMPFNYQIDIVFEDEFLLVLDKPAGLVVHPAPGHWDDTLLNALVARGTSLSQGTGRPGLVHRLDKDTSGLMIVAKTDDVHRALSLELSRRRIRRVYAALIWGHIDKPLEIEAPVGRNPQDRKRMAVLATGRPALTHVEPVARFDATDLLRVSLASGRTHQIRVHLAHIGHPIVGDPVYHGGGSRRVAGQQRSHAKAIPCVRSRKPCYLQTVSIACSNSCFHSHILAVHGFRCHPRASLSRHPLDEKARRVGGRTRSSVGRA